MSISRIFIIFAVLSTMLIAPSVSAGSGKALLSHFRSASWSGNSSSQTDTDMHLSNISAETITVTVTFFDDIGNVISDSGNNSSVGKLQASNISNYSENSNDHSVRFDLAAGNTTRVRLDLPNTSIVRGYGIIEWQSDSIQTTNALIGHVMIYRNAGSNIGYYDVAINNGQAF